MPPASSRLKPAPRIMGIVNVPVVAVLATALPESEPISPLESTATFAGPPTLSRKRRRASSTTAWVVPVASRTAPKSTKRKTYVNITLSAMPKTPWLWRKVCDASRSRP